MLGSSFLHHVPDYLKPIRDAAAVTAAYGESLSIEDPMRYDSMKRFDLPSVRLPTSPGVFLETIPSADSDGICVVSGETSATGTTMTLSII